ncbi:MAG: HAD family hydrolase, partial [Cobetia amphilecti]
QAGFRLVTLTNSPAGASPTPLEKAGISEAFEQHFSVDSVKQFKPAPATYQHVAEQLEVELGDMCMIACHVWDTIGAQAAENVPTPDFIAAELMTLADQLIAAREA